MSIRSACVSSRTEKNKSRNKLTIAIFRDSRTVANNDCCMQTATKNSDELLAKSQNEKNIKDVVGLLMLLTATSNFR